MRIYTIASPLSDDFVEELRMFKPLCYSVVLLAIVPLIALAEKPQVHIGTHKVFLPPGKYGGFKLSHFPDQPISILSERPLSFLMVCGNGTMQLSGRNLASIQHAAPKLAQGAGNEFDNGYAGIGGIYRSGRNIYALYHAEDHVGKSSAIADARNQFAGMFSVGLAVSRDNGQTFEKQGQVLSSSHPYKDGLECGGLGDISMCLDRSGKFLLAYYADFSRGQGKGIQIATARCAIADNAAPGRWKKHHNGSFSEPGLGGKESYVMEVKNADAWCPHVSYVKELDRYLMTFARTENGETDGTTYYRPEKSGLYIASSKDGVNWSEPVIAFKHSVLLIKGSPGALHPTLHISRVANGAAIGTLFYAYTPDWATTPHHLAARPISISLSESAESRDLKTALAGTKWMNSANVSFEWTTDGKFLHRGIEREWRVLDENRVQIVFKPNHKDTLVFDASLSSFKQLIRGGPSSFQGKPR